MNRSLLLGALAVVLAACVAPAPVAPPVVAVYQPPAGPPLAAPGPFALRNQGFEDNVPMRSRCAPGWSCTMHADIKSFRFYSDDEGAAEGKRSFCIEPTGKEPWALMTQGTFDRSLHGVRMRFSIAMRLTGVEGRGAGPWAQVVGPWRERPTYQSLTRESPGWQTRSVEFDVPADAVTVEVGATLRGKGRACFDDARLEVLHPLPKKPA